MPQPNPLNELQETLNKDLREALSLVPSWTEDAYGNRFGWLRLPRPDKLTGAAKALAALKARLCTISAYAEQRDDRDKKRSIAYHFALGSLLFTVTVRIYDPQTLDKLPVPSITPWFRNADWNEREFREMFNIEITGHPDPRRLFLDERLDAGIMTSLIPFSAMLHSAGSQDLWERVMAEKAGLAAQAPEEAGPILEPAFTPVDQSPALSETPAPDAAETSSEEK
ncbi:MAG: NADH-quinone oxidoreductase subunit C [Deltaproteobacteria bacterium]|jgi:NADH:ubiquinone oxidoreductase subunit C|nr:NADH-quinone oxidoreductase subunit C [Deltaproteobacteria bacterium]